MGQGDRWWMIQEVPFQSRLPVLGRIVVWIRETWNSVATKWYVRPLIEQQNAINRKFANDLDGLEGVREELLVVQSILVSIDMEQLNARRIEVGALHTLADEVGRLHQRLEALESRGTSGDSAT
jgi:hypothetical protein